MRFSIFVPPPVGRRCSFQARNITSQASTGRKVVLDDWAKIFFATHLHADLIEADALEWEPDKMFDAILLDAPCSATGTFRRHPEVLFRAGPTIIAQSAKLQRELLSRASKWLKPKGELVYSVCSLEIEEGEGGIVAIPCFQSSIQNRSARLS